MSFFDKMKETSDESNSKLFKTLSDEIYPDDEFSFNDSSIHKERIENAPKNVQDYYNGNGIKFEKGFFRVLVANKSNRMIFFTMIFMFAIVFITNNLSSRKNIVLINGYECELQSFSYDDILYASVKIHPVKKTLKSIEKLKKSNDKTQLQNYKFPLNIIFYGNSDSGVQMKFPKEINSEVFDNTIIYRSESPDYNVINVVAKITIGDQSKESIVKVLRNFQ